MRRILSCMLVAGFMLALATGASAASFTLTAGATVGSPLAGTIPLVPFTNAFFGVGNLFPGQTTMGGYFGSTVNYNVVGAGSVLVEFFGGEAGFNDQFQWGGVTPPGFDHSGSPLVLIAPSLAAPLSTFSTPLAGSGVLPFNFMVNFLVGGASGGPVNGSNPLNVPGLPPNFFVACGPVGGVPAAGAPAAVPAPCTGQLYVFLDDNGANNDDDHDDLMVRITLFDGPPTVPEPTSFALLGSGLLGLGLVARRMRK